jgi:hypothetical protein
MSLVQAILLSQPSNKKEIFTFVITTLQMTQIVNLVENKIEIIVYVHFLDLTPSMTVIFHVHSLHFTRMAFQVFN